MIQTDESTISYAGNSSIVTPYPVPFYFFTDGDLVVVVKDDAGIEEPQVLDTDYVVNGEGDPNGGNIVMAWAVPATSTVTIYREISATQLTSYEEADAFPAKSHERALDKLTMLVQQALRVTGSGGPADLGRAFRLSEASTGINAVGKISDSSLGIDAFGNAVLRTSGEMIGWLGMVGTAWADTAARLVTQPTYIGQLGCQIDNGAIYRAASMSVGDWDPFLVGNGIVITTDGVPSAVIKPAGDIVGTNESQVLLNKTLVTPSISNPTGLDKNDVGLSNVDNTGDMDKPLSDPQAQALSLYQSTVQKGTANGYPSLDASGKIPLPQIPDSVLGASQYQGTWNAATNSPPIPAAGLGNKGWYYSVAVAGTTSIDGINSWAVGDQIISNGTAWEKIPNVSAVNSVNGKTGVVVITKGDVTLGNVDNTSDATKNAASATLTNKTIRGADQVLMDVRLDADVSGNLPVARLNGGTGAAPDSWWCGDGSWKKPPGTGDVNGPAIAGDNDIALFSGTSGKIIKTTGRQIGNVVDGPASAVADHIPQFSGPTGKLLKDGKVAPAGEIVGTTDTQTLSNKTMESPIITRATQSFRASGLLLSNTQVISRTTVGTTVIWNYTIPAGLLSKDGDMLRLWFHNATGGTGAVARGIRFLVNSVIAYDLTNASTVQIHWENIVMLGRVNATDLRVAVLRTNDNASANSETSTLTGLDFTAPIATQLYIFVNAVSGGTASHHHMSTLEFLPLL